jgi:hypothetical protein
MHKHLERNEAKDLVKNVWEGSAPGHGEVVKDIFRPCEATSSSVLARSIPMMWAKFARKCAKDDSPALNNLLESLGHKVDRTKYLWDEREIGTEGRDSQKGDKEREEESNKYRKGSGQEGGGTSSASTSLTVVGEESLAELVSPDSIREKVRWRDVLHKGIKGVERYIEAWVSEQTQARMQNKTCSWHDRHSNFCDRSVDSEYLSLCTSHMKEFRELMELPLLRRQSAVGHLSDQELHDYVYFRVWPMVTTAIEELMTKRNEERTNKIRILLEFKAALYTYRCFFNESLPDFLLALLEWVRRALVIPTTEAVATFKFAVRASFIIFGICLFSKDLKEDLLVGCVSGAGSLAALSFSLTATTESEKKGWLLFGSLLGVFSVGMVGKWVHWWYTDSPPSLGAYYRTFTKLVYERSDFDRPRLHGH